MSYLNEMITLPVEYIHQFLIWMIVHLSVQESPAKFENCVLLYCNIVDLALVQMFRNTKTSSIVLNCTKAAISYEDQKIRDFEKLKFEKDSRFLFFKSLFGSMRHGTKNLVNYIVIINLCTGQE